MTMSNKSLSSKHRFGARLAPLALALALAPASLAAAAPAREWLGEEMPLPLAVKTSEDLAVKAIAEKQYLIFNLLAGGKVAWDAHDFATAAKKWDALLRVPALDPEIDRVIRPLAAAARERSGEKAPVGGGAAVPPLASPSAASPARERIAVVTVSGTVVGGGAAGPGGAVVWLKRTDGETPRPAPARGKFIDQRNKSFVPHVLAIPVGTKVSFRNDDAIYHNVFSLSKPNSFDTGLYKQGGTYEETFRKPGAVQLLCNIHSSMLGYVYVVDSPYYAQADGAGAFTIKGVPPGEYEIEVWHEGSSKNTRQRLTVTPEGARGVELRVGGDRRPPEFVPDKSGKPRQSHLGY